VDIDVSSLCLFPVLQLFTGVYTAAYIHILNKYHSCLNLTNKIYFALSRFCQNDGTSSWGKYIKIYIVI